MAPLKEQLRLIGLSLAHAAADGDMPAVLKWAKRAEALAADPEGTVHPKPAPVVSEPGYFVRSDDSVAMVGGSPNNPNGVSMTVAQAIAWWSVVFEKGLNVSHVRPTLMPGTKVLTPEGLAAARKLGVESTDFAPEDFNPLALPVVP
jgi:hypothetical protein